MNKITRIVIMILFTIPIIFGVNKVEASYGGLDWVVITAPNQITATFEHSLSTYDISTYTNLGLGLAGRSIVDVAATTSNTITLDFDGPPVAPNTTGSIDVGPIDWSDAPGGFAGGTGYPVDDGQIPKLGAVTLQDLDNSGGLSPGDTLSFRFDEPMRQDITTENIDSYFSVGDGHSFGTVEHGLNVTWNNSSTTLTITIPTDSTVAPGDTVFPLSTFSDIAGNIMNNMPAPVQIPTTITTPRTLYFFSNTSYADWYNINNWWNDSAHTDQASSTPTEYDNVVVDSTISPDVNDEFYVKSLVFSDIAPDTQNVLNFFFMNINASDGIIVNNNWNIMGSIIGNIVFNNFSAAGNSYGLINNNSNFYLSLSNIVGNVTFNASTTANYGTIYGNTTFHGYYGNAGLIYGNTEFNDSTSNPGIIFGNVIFRDQTGNDGIIHGNVDVYSPSQNPLYGSVDGSVTYHGYDVDGGSGTPQDPYLISTCSELQAIKNNLSSSYKLTADIDCSESSTWNSDSNQWVDGIVGGTLIPDSYASTTHTNIIVENNGYSGFEPIGISSPFTGSFDGDGHTISNLWIFRETTSGVGIFGNVQNATIKNITVASSSIVGGSNTGGVVGFGDGIQASSINLNENMVRAYLSTNGGGFIGNLATGTLDHIKNNLGTVHGSGNIIGGIVGYMQNGTISDSNSSANTDGGLMIGGFVGRMDNGQITRSFASGSATSNQSEYVVMKTGLFAGGFAGFIGSGIITNSYATGDVSTSGGYAGGFAGYMGGQVTVSQSYSTGNVSGMQEIFDNVTFNPNYIGGFVGQTSSTNLSKTFATGNVTSVGDYIGGYAGDVYSGVINDAYESGTVTGNGNVGGFAGHISVDSLLNNIYARGSVTSNYESTTNGLIGVADNDIIPSNSFWDIQTVGQPSQSSSIEKTTLEMNTKSTFTDAGWDFDNVWTIKNGINNGYPVLLFALTPEVSSVTPSDASINVSTTTNIIVNFSIPMDTSSIIISTTTCGYSCNSYTQSWSNNNQTLTLTKIGDPFTYNSNYTISILSALNAGGISINQPFTWSFTTNDREQTPSQTVYTSAGGLIASFDFLNPTTKNVPVIIKNLVDTNNIIGTNFKISTTGLPKGFIFKKDLYPLISNTDVKYLQIFLNNNGFIISKTGAGSPGKENSHFGLKTKQALIKFQEVHAKDILIPQGFKKGTGILGPYTRKVLNSWIVK